MTAEADKIYSDPLERLIAQKRAERPRAVGNVALRTKELVQANLTLRAQAVQEIKSAAESIAPKLRENNVTPQVQLSPLKEYGNAWFLLRHEVYKGWRFRKLAGSDSGPLTHFYEATGVLLTERGHLFAYAQKDYHPFDVADDTTAGRPNVAVEPFSAVSPTAAMELGGPSDDLIIPLDLAAPAADPISEAKNRWFDKLSDVVAYGAVRSHNLY